MGTLLIVLCILIMAGALAGAVLFCFLWWNERTQRMAYESERGTFAEKSQRDISTLTSQVQTLKAERDRLIKWEGVARADEKARQIIAEAQRAKAAAASEAARLVSEAEQRARAMTIQAAQEAGSQKADAKERAEKLEEEAERLLQVAKVKSAEIVKEAEKRAEKIAGDAYEAVRNAQEFERTARAMKNIIEGYGDEYLVPSESLLDDLAADFGHKEAGQKLTLARAHTKSLIKNEMAAQCDYAEANRREGAERFVIDAFNGKVDSILSRVRHDNAGKLEQEIKDAFTLVNFGGKPFRNARITEEYLAARLEELRWGATAQHLRVQEQEEQRRIREQLREEQKAQREIERALREAAEEEELIRNAMAKAEAQMAKASAEQRAKFEAQLQEYAERLKAAEEKNQRALSMAQQTKRGHVYIISNVGSLGEDVYKIGLTRRMDPMDRIWELGDASVPFDFDVHAMIPAEDAPALEQKLHKHFLINQVNKVNHRKEFFRAKLADIRSELESLGMKASWTMVAEAKEYRESLAIEKTISSDPVARQQWIERQLQLDPVQMDVADDNIEAIQVSLGAGTGVEAQPRNEE